MINTEVQINLSSQVATPIIQAVQGDTGRSVTFVLSDLVIPSGAEATYYVAKPSGECVYNVATISGNSIICDLTAQSLAEVGENNMQVRVLADGKVVTSFEALLMVRAFIGDGAVESSTESTVFDRYFENAKEEFHEAAQEVAEQVIETIPKDYTKLTEEVSSLNERLDNVIVQTRNLLPAGEQTSDVRGSVVVYDNGHLTVTGAPTASGGRGIHLTPVFTLEAGTYYFSANGITSTVTGIYIETNVGDNIVRNGAGVFTLSSQTDLYIGINIEPNVDYAESVYLQIERGSAATPFVIPTSAIDVVARADISELETQLEEINSNFERINLFNPSKAIRDKYVAPGGAIGNIANYSISEYIYIGNLTSISYTGTFRLSLYNNEKTWVSDPTTQNTLGFIATIERPENAEYMIVSYLTANENIVQVGKSITTEEYYDYSKYRMPNLIIDDEPDPTRATIYVSKTGRGSYTSLLEALTSTTNNIEVVDGAFDIVAEYKAKYGNNFFDANFDKTIAGDFRYGLYITNRTVKFDANTSVTFDLSDNPASNVNNDDRRFSLFNLGVNAILDGAIGTTVGNWYAIHDDGAGGDYAQNYTNIIRNCVIISSNMVNKNSIGGGCGRYSQTFVENCYFDNGETDLTSYTIRYHNTWNGQAQPSIYIKNCYVNARIYFGYYGSSTKIGTCVVNNCSMGGSIALLPVTTESVENLRVLEWANVIRS